MKDKVLHSLAVALLIISIMMRLFGISLHPFIDAYKHVATTIMTWFIPELFTETYPAGFNTLSLFVPLILLTAIALFIVRLIYRFRYRRYIDSGASGKERE